MCMVSMVFDRWEPILPKPYDPWRTDPALPPWTPAVPAPDLQKQLEEFMKQLAAAKKEDEANKAPDCFDPKKATLLQRVSELEKRLAEIEKTVGK